jgi:hypothetical protein
MYSIFFFLVILVIFYARAMCMQQQHMMVSSGLDINKKELETIAMAVARRGVASLVRYP